MLPMRFMADGEIALPVGVIWIALDEGLDKGLTALVVVQGGFAISKGGINVAQEKMGPSDLVAHLESGRPAQSAVRSFV